MEYISFLNKKTEEFLDNYDDKSDAWKLGYTTFGLLLFGFCLWINEEKEKKNLSNIHFLARDGYIVKKAYETIFGESTSNKYFYLSRRSLCLPAMIEAKSSKEILDKLIFPPSFNLNDFLSLLNINDELDLIKDKYHIPDDMLFYRKEAKDNKLLKKIISDKFDRIMNEIKKQNTFFVKYMKQEKVHNEVMIVDIGWHCSIQNLLSYIDSKISINGYYVGVYDDAKKMRNGSTSFGFLYDLTNKNNYQYKTFSFVSLFESMFLSHEGTTLGYENVSGIIKPILNDYEYKDKEYMLKTIDDFQNGAIKFCYDHRGEIEQFKNIPNHFFADKLINMCMNPDKKVIEIFGKLDFENYSNQNIINFNKNPLYYYFHLSELKNDFYKSGWRIAFLKKLLPFPFPHYMFFKLLCKLFL